MGCGRWWPEGSGDRPGAPEGAGVGNGEAGGAEVGVRAARLKGSNTCTQVIKMLSEHKCLDAGGPCSARHTADLSDNPRVHCLACQPMKQHRLVVQKQVCLEGEMGAQPNTGHRMPHSELISHGQRCTPPMKSITRSQVLHHSGCCSGCCKGPQQGKHPPGVPGHQLAAQ